MMRSLLSGGPRGHAFQSSRPPKNFVYFSRPSSRAFSPITPRASFSAGHVRIPCAFARRSSRVPRIPPLHLAQVFSAHPPRSSRRLRDGTERFNTEHMFWTLGRHDRGTAQAGPRNYLREEQYRTPTQSEKKKRRYFDCYVRGLETAFREDLIELSRRAVAKAEQAAQEPLRAADAYVDPAL